MLIPYCSRCKAKNVDGVKYSKSQGRQYYQCRECNRKRIRAYRKKNMALIIEITKRYEKKNPEKRKSWTKAQCIPIAPCEICGSTENIVRHHPDSKKALEVVMLCRPHHFEAHKKS